MRTVQFINHDHPASQAAFITSEAVRRVYIETRIQTTAFRTTQKARRESQAALALAERIHSRVTDTLKNTPEAWYVREVSA